MDKSVVIASAVRTPIGDFMGALSSLSAVDLGVVVAERAIKKANISKSDIEEVITGIVFKEGVKGNPARQIQLNCNIPKEGAALTLDQQCASSMRALEIGMLELMTGRKECCLIIGTESMSNVPYLLMDVRDKYKFGSIKLEDALFYDGLKDAFLDYHMGITAENLAEIHNISREKQDKLALLSHQRAVKSIKDGKFRKEITPIKIEDKKSNKIIKTDEHPKELTSFQKLSKLKPVFKKTGTVTAGNSSAISDGAAGVILMTEEFAKKKGIKPLAKILSSSSYGVAPEIMGIGPAYGIPKSLNQAGLTLEDIDYFEINEAFAAQFLAVKKVLNLDMGRVNLNGSGISLGHPTGCTGLRLIVTLLYELKRQNSKYGVASLCAGGGPSMSTVIENIY